MYFETLIIMAVLILFLFPFALIIRSFIYYTEPLIHCVLYLHWHPDKSVFPGQNVDFRGGGAPFGK